MKCYNEEVQYGFLNSLVPAILGTKDAENPVPIRDMVLHLEKGNVGEWKTAE